MRAALAGALLGMAILASGSASLAGARVPCPCTQMDSCGCPLPPLTPEERGSSAPAHHAAQVAGNHRIHLAPQEGDPARRTARIGEQTARDAATASVKPAGEARLENRSPPRQIVVGRDTMGGEQSRAGNHQSDKRGEHASREEDTEEITSGGATSGGDVEPGGLPDIGHPHLHEQTNRSDPDDDYGPANGNWSPSERPASRESHSPRTAMSINDPAALAPWHGYGAACPDRLQ